MDVQHFLTTEDWSMEDISSMIDHARFLKASPISRALQGKTIALLFFNPSLRTRTSFELGVFQMGGHAVVLEPGNGAWKMAFDLGEVMDGDAEEHVKEAAGVLSRYCDMIAVRCFPTFECWETDREDRVLRAFAAHSSVPVINMETIVHPCQELAHAMTLQESLGDLRGRKYLLTWTYHPRPLNTAVANSSLLIATRLGLDVTLLCPDERFMLDDRFVRGARSFADESGGSLTVTHDVDAAYDGAEIVYAKSWGALSMYGNWSKEKPIRDSYTHFIVDEQKMALTNNAYFSHCLPARRNVKATDGVMDSPRSLILDEAENRLHVQKALMSRLCSPVQETAGV
ncbi:MAG: N-acetylornithine carbamoyltransferase [Phycisphaerales bacterium JB043]